jgi:TolB-like protein/DNA-binding winged helix-turn-helix (wHTH) protein
MFCLGNCMYDFGPFRLDPKNKLLLRDGSSVPLTPKTFDALLLLVERSGRLIEKEEFQRLLWPDTFVEEGMLAWNISRLRKKLGETRSQRQFIETVPKRGYRFIAAVKLVVAANGPGAPNGGGLANSDGPDAAASMAPKHGREERPPGARSKTAAWVALVAVALVAGTAATVFHPRRAQGPASPAALTIRSVAVLPLENLSGDPNQDYLAEGMTDELITDLAQIHSLRVVSRASVMPFKGTQTPLKEIARRLNVDAVVEGTIVKSGDRVRVDAQLIEAADDRDLWAESFEREAQNLVGLEDSVAQAIAESIRANLSPAERARMRAAGPVDPQAYEDYLWGRYYWNKRTPEGLRRALEYFEQATKKDPNFAGGYAGLADCYVLLSDYHVAPAQEAFPKAEAAARRALELDPRTFTAHAALGDFHFRYDWDWGAAEKEYRQAIALNPNYADGYHRYAEFLVMMGRFNEGLKASEKAAALDPLSLIVQADRAWFLYLARRDGEALEALERMIKHGPSFPLAYFYLGEVYEQQHQYAKSLAAFRKADELSGGQSGAIGVAYTDALAGRRRQASRVEHSLERWSVPPEVGIAVVYGALGENDRAFRWLKRAYRDRNDALIYLKVLPLFDPLRDDPRYSAMLRQVGFTP